MELRHLRYFVAVAEEGHVTRAAERLGIQQPPLSQQIRALEAELGVVLFQRGARGMTLTAAGDTFLQEARGVLAAAAQGVARARLAAQGQYGRVSVGITTSATLHPLVPQILGAYWRAHPDVLLQIHEANASDVTDAIAAGTLDAAFLRAPVSTPLGLVFRELATEALVLARLVRPGDTHTERRVALGDLRAERFILVRRPAAPGLYATIVEACRAADFEPVVVAEVGRMLTAVSLVAAGMGIALLPASMSAIRVPGVRYSAVVEPTLRAPLTLVYRADEGRPVVTDFVQTAVAAAEPRGIERPSSRPIGAP